MPSYIQWIDDGGAGVSEIDDVARDDNEIMDDCGRSNQAIGIVACPLGYDATSLDGDLIRNG
jgi:hypothetical protein